MQELFCKNSVQRSSDGYIYICGATLNADGNYDVILTKMTANNESIWSVTYAGMAGGDDFASDLVIDNSGDIIVTGTEYISSTNYNAVTIKYNSSGIQQWITTYNGIGPHFWVLHQIISLVKINQELQQAVMGLQKSQWVIYL